MSKSITSMLFRAARYSADARAVSKGPEAIAKRLVRKQVYKTSNRVVAAFIRGLLK